jgi:hypothetical protein
MKQYKIIFSLFTLMLLVILSCNQDEKLEEPINEFVNIDFPDTYKYKTSERASFNEDLIEVVVEVVNEDGSVINGKMRFTMPENSDEKLVKFEITQNLLDETKLDENFWLNNDSGNEFENLRKLGCLANCQKEWTDRDGEKIKGRGLCKASCWAQTAAKVAAVVVAVIAIVDGPE